MMCPKSDTELSPESHIYSRCQVIYTKAVGDKSDQTLPYPVSSMGQLPTFEDSPKWTKG